MGRGWGLAGSLLLAQGVRLCARLLMPAAEGWMGLAGAARDDGRLLGRGVVVVTAIITTDPPPTCPCCWAAALETLPSWLTADQTWHAKRPLAVWSGAWAVSAFGTASVNRQGRSPAGLEREEIRALAGDTEVD